MYETNKKHHFVLSTISKGMRSFDIIYGANTSTKCYQIHKTIICTTQPFLYKKFWILSRTNLKNETKKITL